jgi:hypothetical protein
MFQTGYYALGNYATPYYMRGELAPPEFTPEPVFPPGMGRAAQWIREDDEIMAIIIAFLHMKGR